MRKMSTKSTILKYVALVLGAVFLVTSVLVFSYYWDETHGTASDNGGVSDVIRYHGKEYVSKENLETFLVLGLDKYEGEGSADSYNNDKQADFLMLFVFDNNAESFSAIHINRDTMANVRILAVDETKVVGTVTKQIALAHTYGRGKETSCRNTKDSVEDLLKGVTVNHYLSVTMDAVPAMNDFVGGVELTVLDDFTGIDESLVKGETVTLNGEQALHYVRTRYGLDDSSNNTRMERQQQYIEALYEKTMACVSDDDEFLIKLIDTMDDYVVYDSSNYKMQKFVEKFDQYQFNGIVEIEGESKLGKEFMEFYPDSDSILKIVVDLFYKPKD